jgi:C-terminal processing protease CtpA/Prc
LFISETFRRLSPVHDGHGHETINTYTLRRIEGYDGLGILIATDAQTRSQHFIREVEVGSPAYRAGLRKNDRIIHVNNISVESMDFSNVLMLIKQGLDNDNLQISVVHQLDSI